MTHPNTLNALTLYKKELKEKIEKLYTEKHNALLTGGKVKLNTNDTFNIGAGSGTIVDISKEELLALIEKNG